MWICGLETLQKVKKQKKINPDFWAQTVLHFCVTYLSLTNPFQKWLSDWPGLVTWSNPSFWLARFYFNEATEHCLVSLAENNHFSLWPRQMIGAVLVSGVPKIFLCPIKTIHLSRKEPYIWIQHKKSTRNFLMRHWKFFFKHSIWR